MRAEDLEQRLFPIRASATAVTFMGIGALFGSCFTFRATLKQPPETTVPSCAFCEVSREKGFNVVWEDEKFVVFKDRSPAAEHHLLVTPKVHIESVRSLSAVDVPMIESMHAIGHQILDELGVSAPSRRLGFHIPPFNSVNHLHLHLQGLPYKSSVKQAKYPVTQGKNGNAKGFGWFVQVDQAIQILQRGGQVGVFPC